MGFYLGGGNRLKVNIVLNKVALIAHLFEREKCASVASVTGKVAMVNRVMLWKQTFSRFR